MPDRNPDRPRRVEEDVEGHDGKVQGVHVEVLEDPDDLTGCCQELEIELIRRPKGR